MARINRKLLLLKFEDPDFEGVEVRIRSTSLGNVIGLRDQADAARKGRGLDEVSDLADQFVARLESWNIEDENGDVPATREGLLTLDLPDALYLILSWFDAMTAVDPDLKKESTSGNSSPEVSIPMEPL